jgi:hypothetical protein
MELTLHPNIVKMVFLFLRVVDLQGSTVNLDNVMRISPLGRKKSQ